MRGWERSGSRLLASRIILADPAASRGAAKHPSDSKSGKCASNAMQNGKGPQGGRAGFKR